MINSIEDLRSSGTLPSGPCSAWPKERNIAGPGLQGGKTAADSGKKHDSSVKIGLGAMAQGFIKTTKQAISHGKVSREIREERYAVCKSCPHFIEESKRCSECGCFMEAKTWVAGPAKHLCPKNKWAR